MATCLPQALVGVLHREQTLVLKLKANPSVLILAARLLTAVLHKSRNWPESLAKVGGTGLHGCLLMYSVHTHTHTNTHTHNKQTHTQTHIHAHTHAHPSPSLPHTHALQAYVDDALTVRVWVDLEQCKKLVDNINTIFHTATPPGVSSSGSELQPSSHLQWFHLAH